MKRTEAGHAGLGFGAYSLLDASRIIRVPFQKLRRWASGYWYLDDDQERFSAAVVPSEDSDENDERILSFYELMELFVVGFYRAQGVSMQVVRAARLRAQEVFDTEYPFATRKLPTDGKRIFVELAQTGEFDMSDKRLTMELLKGQLALDEMVRPFFRELDFSTTGLAYRYWPLGREQPIILDARRSFGRPIIENSGVPTYALFDMAEAGEDREAIARWYRVSRRELDAAIEYEQHLRAA